MKNNNNACPHPYGSPEDVGAIEDYTVASSTECTGLVPTPPIDMSEVDSYHEIYDIPLSDETVESNLQDEKKKGQ